MNYVWELAFHLQYVQSGEELDGEGRGTLSRVGRRITMLSIVENDGYSYLG